VAESSFDTFQRNRVVGALYRVLSVLLLAVAVVLPARLVCGWTAPARKKEGSAIANAMGRAWECSSRSSGVGAVLDRDALLLDRVAGNQAPSTGSDCGRSTLQRSLANGQRGWKVQPEGGLIGLGTSPATGARWRPVISRSGIVSSSMRV